METNNMEKETKQILALIRKHKVIYGELKRSAHDIIYIKLYKNDLIMKVKRRPNNWQLCSFDSHDGKLYVGYEESNDPNR